MKKERVKLGIYLPKEIYAELYKRQLPEHFSFLVACLLEEFFKRTDISISREEMPTRAEQREYLKRKLKEFFSRSGLYAQGSPKPPVQERRETSYVQEPPSPPMRETPKETYTTLNPQPVKEEKTPSTREDLELDEEVLRRIESFW
jgi:hypothetical protein